MVVRPALAAASRLPAERGLRLRVRDVGPHFLFGILPAAFLVGLVTGARAEENSFDFWVFWEAGRHVLEGVSPYPPADPAVLRSEHEFVYPAPAALAMVGLAALPYSVAAPLFTLLLIGAAAVALRLCGVTDWRCYGLASMTAPLALAIGLGTVTPLLLLGLAALWRYRNRLVVAGLVAAGLIVLKLFLWPLLVWFAATRRTLSAVVAVAAAGFATLGSWAVLGFAGLGDYPRLLATLSDLLEGKGYSLTALALASGLPEDAARAFSLGVGGTGLAALVLAARRGRREWPLFVAAIGLALALSPIVWSHYFALLLVPLAVSHPRLSWLWAVTVLFWLVPGQSAFPPVWEGRWIAPEELPSTPRVGDLSLIVFGIAVASIILVAAARVLPPLALRRPPSTAGQRPAAPDAARRRPRRHAGGFTSA